MSELLARFLLFAGVGAAAVLLYVILWRRDRDKIRAADRRVDRHLRLLRAMPVQPPGERIVYCWADGAEFGHPHHTCFLPYDHTLDHVWTPDCEVPWVQEALR